MNLVLVILVACWGPLTPFLSWSSGQAPGPLLVLGYRSSTSLGQMIMCSKVSRLLLLLPFDEEGLLIELWK